MLSKKIKENMATEELKNTSPIHKEFQNLLDQDFKDRKLVTNQVIKAKVIDILKSYVVVDVRGKSGYDRSFRI